MAPKTSQAKEHARLQLRDEHGHFIKGSTVKAKTSISSPLDLVDTEFNRRAEFEKPLLQVSITNPFKKIFLGPQHSEDRMALYFGLIKSAVIKQPLLPSNSPYP